MNAYSHICKAGSMIGYAQSKGVPFPKVATIGSGIFLLLGGLGTILGIYVHIALSVIVVFFLIVTFKMHAFWKVQDPTQRMMEHIQFMKNMAILGATLMLFALPLPWMFSLGW